MRTIKLLERTLLVVLAGAAWVGGTGHAYSSCAWVAHAWDVGSYWLPVGGGMYYYEAGRSGVFGEKRNWFAFSLPIFSDQLVGAELRLTAGTISLSPTTAVAYELHPVRSE